MTHGTATAATAAFSQGLAALKRRGSSLLITGAAVDEAHLAASQRLLGAADTTRRRLLVFTDGTPSLDGRVAPLERGADRVAVIDATSLTRASTAATAASATYPLTRVAPDDMVSLGTAISDAITEFDTAVNGLESAELRVCFDSLRPLLDEDDQRDVFHFLHAVTSDIHRVNGMGHFHLPVPRDDPTAEALAPLFDAVIELREASDGEYQQRWTLRDHDITTDWLPL
jgi:hypothetical protein